VNAAGDELTVAPSLAVNTVAAEAVKALAWWMSFLHLKKNIIFNKDKRLFHCGSQEAGLVKYDKYTCKK